VILDAKRITTIAAIVSGSVVAGKVNNDEDVLIIPNPD
jgi:GTPase